jgi:DNA-binding SARP family transcriptional activator/tetratricopeptide (TPR) repeat protein
VHFRVLGPLEVAADDGSAVRLSAGRARIVLALLCAAPGQVVSRDRLIDLAWRGQPPATAVTQLHAYISGLRQKLESRYIVTEADGYTLRAGQDEVDLLRMRSLARQAHELAGREDLRGAATLLAEATGLWRGRPFTGFDLPELDTTARLIEEEYLGVLESYAEAGLRAGDHAALVLPLTEACGQHPLREKLHAALITALTRSGRSADALTAYHRLRTGLAEELGVDPSQGLQQLYLSLLGQETATAPVRPAQLPPGIGDFTGRAGDVRRLCAELAAAGELPAVLAVAVVSGAGGIGKTALAIQAAHLAAGQFTDGQLYVDLGGASASPAVPADVLAQLLRDLGSSVQDLPRGVAELTARFRSILAGRKMLLVLDDAKDAAQVRPLLPGTAGCAVLVSSRASLADLAGARHLGLTELDADEADELFTRIIGIDRAAAEPEAAGRVLRSCAGLPLAIRIAGARLAVRTGWSIGAMADRLEAEHSRLAELHVGDMAVRASFRLSYTALTRERAEVFRLLGLSAPGTLSLAAAAALTGLDVTAAERVLDELADVHLVDAQEHGRYRLHELLRLFAAELAAGELGQAERDAAIRRLIAWYAAALRAAAQALRPAMPWTVGGPSAGQIPAFATRGEALAWCDLEEPALLWAAATATAHGWHDLVVPIALSSRHYYTISGSPQTSERVQRLGLASARPLGDEAACATILYNLSYALDLAGDHQAARSYLEEALTAYRRLGDRTGEAYCLAGLARSYRGQGRYAAALEQNERAVRIAEELGNGLLRGGLLHNLSRTLFHMADYEGSAARSGEAVRLMLEHGDPADEGLARTGLGEALRALGRLDEAVEQFRLAIAIGAELGNSYRRITDALIQLAATLADLGRTGEARQIWARAVRLTEQTAEPRASEFRAQLEAVREKLDA